MWNGKDPIDAVVLAGGVNGAQPDANNSGSARALLPIHGKPSIAYVFEALNAAPHVARVAIVGNPTALAPAVGDAYPILPGGETLWDNLATGLRHFTGSPAVLMTTADTPLITSETIADFLAACRKTRSDFDYNLHLAMVPATQFTGPFAECAKSFNRFRDGAISYGNLLLADPGILNHPEATRRIGAVYSARKNRVRSALAVGLRVGLGYVLGVHLWHLLTLQHMARMASARFHVGLVPVLIDHPEIAIDIDEPASFECVQKLLAAE